MKPTASYSQALDSVGRGTTVMSVSTILLLAFNFISRVAVAKAFSIDDWGIFSLGLALSGFLSLVALLGFHQAMARTLSYEKDPGMRRKIVRLGFGITLASSVAISALTYLLARPIADEFASGHPVILTQVFQLFSFTIGFTLMSTFLASIFQGFENVKPNAWFNQVLNPALFLVFFFAFLYLHLGFASALFGYVVAGGASLAALAIYTAKELPRLLPRDTRVATGPIPSTIWGLSLSLWGVTTLAFVTAFIDTLILGAYRPSLAVGLYASATTLARLLLVANGALTFVYLPVTARLARERDFETIRSTFATATRWTLVFTFPMFLLFCFMPIQSLGAVFGLRYEDAALALTILGVGSFVSVVVGPVNATLAGLGETRSLLMTTFISATANIVLSFALIPTYGLLGAAVAWTVARALYPTVGLLTLYVAHGITPFRRALVLPLTLACGAGIPLFLLVGWFTHPVWLVFPMFLVGMGIFVGAVIFTRSVDPGDLVIAGLMERVIGRPLPALRRFLERFVTPDPAPAAGLRPSNGL
ncbi:MAG: oligosaccharide flippase family protein [Thermoplasmata archaeon]|nr:oligosaccharide flippase family protein [Thermoplasmata archaeon]